MPIDLEELNQALEENYARDIDHSHIPHCACDDCLNPSPKRNEVLAPWENRSSPLPHEKA